ncbi:MAG: hypothetical protein AAGM29_22665, partial [Cyanobacteria bacterium J06588_4]
NLGLHNISPKFKFETRSTIYQAIALTKKGTADFADYLISAVDHENGCMHSVTFDRKLKPAIKFEVLE